MLRGENTPSEEVPRGTELAGPARVVAVAGIAGVRVAALQAIGQARQAVSLAREVAVLANAFPVY